ncbi:MAG: multidrug efflux RND transporter permease subunit [Desulfobacterales bacterium]|nr:multidrug efflux RND transporter permease subunit [Desulfobacterales bacterium]
MISKVFIERPILATVVSLVIVIAGAVAFGTLPVAQYPEIAPPIVQVTTTYPGANAVVLAETVASPIEQEVNGVENMLYMASTNANDGTYTLDVTFAVGTDIDMAQVLVQNRVNTAEPKLPEEVKRQGVTVKKRSANILMFIALSSPDERYDSLFIHNYITLRIKDELSRQKGVGDVSIFGAEDYSMRVWLDPNRLKALNLTTQDVIRAIEEQNIQVAAGQIGEPPAPAGQEFQYSINTLGRLAEPEEFADIIIKTTEGTRITRVKDVGRVEMGAKTYNTFFGTNGKEAAGISIYPLPGANALDTAQAIRDTMGRLGEAFPEGLEWKIPFDTTLFIEQSIQQVYQTLIEAAIIVFVVIFIFLGDWRAAVIPGVAIPVSLIGTAAAMAALGFSINMISLFGLVLAIGIVVDDAIVVVENVSKKMEEGLSGKEAAIKGMAEITGPVIATTLVLIAVFVPTAFLPGISGQLYRQFALTIATATVFSSINALTMSPALCALILRPAVPGKKQNFFLRGFNRVYGASENGYARIVGGMVRRTAIMGLVYIGLIVLSGWSLMSIPTGFLPIEDQGYAIAAYQLPDAASQERAREVVEKMDAIISKTPGVQDWITVGGFSALDSTNASNAGALYIVFADRAKREDEGLSQDVILAKLQAEFRRIQEASIFTVLPPVIQGLGTSGGFDFRLQDRGGIGPTQLQQWARQIIQDGSAQSGLVGLYTLFRADVPQLFIDVDRTKAKTLDIPLNDVFGTLQAFLGSAYVNDFNKFGRTYQVKVQAEPQFRVQAEDINQLEVRANNGEMVPIGTLVNVEDTLGPQVVFRYNLYPAATIGGKPAAGFSSSQALTLMEQLANTKLPPSLGFEWSAISFQEKQVGGEALLIFALALTLVFLVLSAQYESWSSPAIIIMAVPVALLGTAIALVMRGFDNNLYTQIGIVLLIALASKNAILIVEFARELRAQGKDIVEAAAEAAKLRFRPVLMTAFSFIFGVLPLVFASGAGSASQQAVGTAVFGGMMASTALAVLFVPVFFVIFQRLSEFKRKPKAAEKAPSTSSKSQSA